MFENWGEGGILKIIARLGERSYIFPNAMRILLVLTFFGVLFVPFTVSAATFQAASEYALGGGIVVDDDFYVGGGSVVIAGDIVHDLYAAGGNVLITGKVGGDAVIAGGSVNVLGEVGDDLRVLGGDVVIAKNIRDDLVVAGGTVRLLAGSTVQGDVVVVGGSLVIEGDVIGTIHARVEHLEINGLTKQDIRADVKNDFTLGDKAVIEGKLSYTAPYQVVMSEGALVKGEVSYTKGRSSGVAQPSRQLVLGVISTVLLLKLLSLLAAGSILYLICRKWLHEVVQRACSHFGGEFVRGFVSLVVFPIFVLFLFVSIIGFLLGAIGLLAYGFLLVLSKVMAGIILGGIVATLVSKKEYRSSWLNVLGGILLLFLFSLIPFLGWLIEFVFFIVAFGSVIYFFYGNVRSSHH